MTDIQRDHERRYHGMNSRWLAYGYAVGRNPTGSPADRIPGVELPVIWIGSRMDRARTEIGNRDGALTPGEHTRCDELLWRYAAEERG